MKDFHGFLAQIGLEIGENNLNYVNVHLAFGIMTIDFLVSALVYWRIWLDIMDVTDYVGQNQSAYFY